jgi:N-acetylneuraminate synthase/N,N'-diacetyllegionaminate synthase
MTTGIVVLCRFSSRRLPGKILREIDGIATLGHILGRIGEAAPEHPVVVATSVDPSDDAIASYCERHRVDCHRGPLDDVAGRFLTCAEIRGWDFATRINGDNLFVDIPTLAAMLAIADTGRFDVVTNVPRRTFPRGMSVEIVRTDFYRAAMEGVTDPGHREHVTSRLYEIDVGTRYVYENRSCPAAAGMQLALDTAEDLELARRIVATEGARGRRLGLREIHELVTTGEPVSPWRGAAGPLLIAEIGGNHEGDFGVAKALAESAIGSGADCVKFQLYTGDSLVSPVESPDRNRHFKRFELTRAQHIELAEMCQSAGVMYMSSVWDLEMLEWIDPYLPIYKIGSGDLTAWPVIREFARRGKPILLSTGLATMDEVMQTAAQIQAVDPRYCRPEMLCIMQCTSMYPIGDGDANLRVMDSLRARTGVAVGYSDHTIGSAALRAAAAMGAQVLEFHFTDSREGKTFRDHKVSLVADEVRTLRDEIAQITLMRGSSVKVPQQSELDAGHEVSFRRAVYAGRPVRAGETLHERDLVYLRPAHGTDARDAAAVIGAVALKDIEPFRAMVRGVDYA